MNFTRNEKITLTVLILFGLFSYFSGLDAAVAEFMGSRESLGFSLFFSYYYYIAYVIAAAALLWLRDRRSFAAFLLTLAAQSLIHTLFSTFMPRARPVEAKPVGGLLDKIMGIGLSSSFPSGHSAVAASVYTLFREIKQWKWYTLVATIPVLISRITLVHHHISDVIGGLVLGYVLSKIFYGIFRRA